ncbi:MAG: hypothetical protein DDT34_02258 [Firmicutes bacterium]|nr:hypothetical protein [Bacillota bacterium]
MAHLTAFLDYQERFRGATRLLRTASGSSDPMLATAAAKGAIVLAAAAMERFMNDALRESCQLSKSNSFDQLSESHQAYLCTQIARKIARFDTSEGEVKAFNANQRMKFRSALDESTQALANPSLWQHSPDFGMFMDGAGAPEKINAVIRDFDPEGHTFLNTLDARAPGKAALTRALTELVDARHNAAHAKTATDPSPSDAKTWIVSSYWVTRAIDAHLRKLVS